jgi:hypothetical protein
LAVATKERSPLTPEIPTFAEQGFPGVEVVEHIALQAPAGMPADIAARMHALTKADNLGLGLIVLGLLPLADSLADALKLVLIWALVLLGGTTAAQLVASAVRRDQRPPE